MPKMSAVCFVSSHENHLLYYFHKLNAYGLIHDYRSPVIRHGNDLGEELGILRFIKDIPKCALRTQPFCCLNAVD